MSGFFGINPDTLINSIGSAFRQLAPGPEPGGTFAPSGGTGATGAFQPAPAVAGDARWPTVSPGNGPFQPAELNLGTFAPSGGYGGGWQPSSMNYPGFQPSGTYGSPFQPSGANPLVDPRANTTSPTSTNPLSPTGNTTYTGLDPAVSRWAGQVQSTFADLGDYVPDAMLAIIQHESSGSPTAYNATGDAWGLFQQLHLGTNDPNAQFTAAHALAIEKLRMTTAAYARLGLNPDARTRARDLFLAWAGQFDPNTAGPSSARDIASGEDGNAFLYGPRGIMPMYDNIVKGKQRAAAGPANASGLVQRAQSLLGTPYANGGLRSHPNNPQAGLDCSEYTAWIYQGQGVTLPWNAQQQYNATGRVQNPSDLQVGDLVFFQGTNPVDPDVVTHVGMYIGNGQFINAQDGGVKVANLSDPYWQQHYYGGGRVTSLGGQPAPPSTRS